MPVDLDKWTIAKIRTQCVIDGDHVYWGPPDNPEKLTIYIHGNEPRVPVPGHKFLISLEDLVHHGARVRRRPKLMTKDDINRHNWSVAGGIARWNRTRLPHNVYLANGRSMDYAGNRGKPIPPPKYIGRTGKFRTAVYDTVEEVEAALKDHKFVNT